MLSAIRQSGDIFFAISDREWALDGAAVRVSMVGFDAGAETNRSLDGHAVASINANLTSGLDLTLALPLVENADRCFQGPVKVGDFDIDFDLAASMLQAPNPHGRPNSDVVRPWLNGKGITDRNPQKFIIDFGEMLNSDAALYEMPFAHVEQFVRPTRLANRDTQRRERWWLLGRAGTDLRAAVAGLGRIVCTPRVAKHRLFVWVATATMPDARLYAFASEQNWYFGVLHSRMHGVWSLAQASRHGVGNDPTYSTESCFAPFVFPELKERQAGQIGEVARELSIVRERWLNPPEWVREDVVTFPASVAGPWSHVVEAPNAEGVGVARYRRCVPVDNEAAKALRKRTLTHLYNEKPTWLRDLHQALDEAVLAAYGLAVDVSDERILSFLLNLNLGRAAASPPRK